MALEMAHQGLRPGSREVKLGPWQYWMNLVGLERFSVWTALRVWPGLHLGLQTFQKNVQITVTAGIVEYK
jgi:hypothetical protein